MTKRVGIIAPELRLQASTVRESIECFSKYGHFKYSFIPLKRGRILDNLNNFNALIIHYSAIAFPFRYHLPISASAIWQIHSFGGVKIALVQDEQRAGIERLQFLNNLKIDHLFSVAPEELYSILYPDNERNFSISTVLTGYVSDSHLHTATKDIPLVDRSIDLSYRGRRLPSWMGNTGTLKGDIPILIKNNPNMTRFLIDVSSSETDRIYEHEWYNFLLNSRVSIGTPSGSDYLDLHGKYQENWVPRYNENGSGIQDPVEARYQVISPRFFDYVAAGNLIALTPGEYSNIPKDHLHKRLSSSLSNLHEILDFSKTDEAQRIVNLSKIEFLQNPFLHFRYFVSLCEERISNLSNQFSVPQQISENNYRPDLAVQKMKTRNVVVKLLINLLKYLPRTLQSSLISKKDSFTILSREEYQKCKTALRSFEIHISNFHFIRVRVRREFRIMLDLS